MPLNDVFKIFHNVLKELKIQDNISLELRPFKKKIASFSFDTHILRLNKNFVEISNSELIEYLIFHEICHFLSKDIYHGSNFSNLLFNFYNSKEINDFDLNIVRNSLLLKK